MLRLMEIDILHLMQKAGGSETNLEFMRGSVISIHQFYGIELLDFPHEIAMLSLWLAEHQMNKRFYEDFGVNTDALPLKDITQIKCGNACRVDWNEVCPHTKEEEVFIFGNPPYLGSSLQEQCQKDDMEVVFGENTGWKKLDYICCWFYLASFFCMDSKSSFAFVSTNSICQGEQVPLLWPVIYKIGLDISFAYHSFKWSNNAKHNAAVTVIIVGLSVHPSRKYLYKDGNKTEVENINAYLLKGSNTIVSPERNSISKLQAMIFGSKSSDGGYLILESEEKNAALDEHPEIEPYIKRYVGSDDSINGFSRYCIWVTDEEYKEADKIPFLHERFEGCRKMREASKKASTAEQASTPYKFTEIRYYESDCLVVPRVSSERRIYIPMSFMNAGTVVDGSSQVIYNVEMYTFGIINSLLHMIWVKTVGGRLKTDYRYSAQLCYNTFPFPQISDSKKSEIEEAATEILLTREPHLTVGKTLADLYDPDTMPDDLREAHARLDDIIESCYPGYPFASDEARLECLFKMYEKMTKK